MQINPEYNNYENGVQTSCGACPVEWENAEVSQKQELTWADGNYHLYDGYEFGEMYVTIVENAICAALNGAAETFGTVSFENTDFEVHWCLLEEPQVGVVLDFPQLLQAA